MPHLQRGRKRSIEANAAGKKLSSMGRCRLWTRANAAGFITAATYARYHQAMRDPEECKKYTGLARAERRQREERREELCERRRQC